MKTQQDRFPITMMSRVLGDSRSGFCGWTACRPSVRACEDIQLGQLVQNVHRLSRGTYGAPRIHAELSAGGRHVGRKRVARLMRERACGA
jgi:hypothetical protein